MLIEIEVVIEVRGYSNGPILWVRQDQDLAPWDPWFDRDHDVLEERVIHEVVWAEEV